MIQVNIDVAKAQLSKLIQKALLGEEIIIAKDHKSAVKLAPFQPQKRSRKLGLAKGLITISSDFDEPLEDLGDYCK